MFLTTSQLCVRYGLPAHQARRALDALGDIVQRAALYRLLPIAELKTFEAELQKRGWGRQWASRKGVRVKQD